MTTNQNSDFDVDAYKKITEKALDYAKKKGATQSEVALGMDDGLNVTVRLGDVDTLEFQRDKSMGVTVYFGHAKGSASTSDTSWEAIVDTIDAACDIAKYTAEDEFSGLADREELAFDYPDLDLYHPWDVSAEQAIDIATRCEEVGRAYDKRITNSDGATVSTGTFFRIYGNSHGFIGSYPTSRHSLSCVLIGSDGENMQRDYYYTVGRDALLMETPEFVAKEAAKRTLQRLGARKIDTATVPVIYCPEMSSGLFGHFIAAIRGGNQYRKTSFLLDQLEHQVFPKHITIHEDPFIKGGLGSAPFDAEGVRCREHDLVKDGQLKSYILGSYSARKLGMKTTGNAGGTHNLKVTTSNDDQAAMLKKMGRGLLVTELMGQGVNIITGDYSRGAGGFWIEDGQIAYPVEEITIAGNLKDMLMNIVQVGNDVDKRNNILVGSTWVGNMTLAGN